MDAQLLENGTDSAGSSCSFELQIGSHSHQVDENPSGKAYGPQSCTRKFREQRELTNYHRSRRDIVANGLYWRQGAGQGMCWQKWEEKLTSLKSSKELGLSNTNKLCCGQLLLSLKNTNIKHTPHTPSFLAQHPFCIFSSFFPIYFRCIWKMKHYTVL